MASTLNLSTYVRIGRYDLPEPTRTAAPEGNLLGQEVSGVTFNPETGTLFIVGDGGTYVTQVSTKGELIDTMTLAKGGSPQGTEFYDPEGIAHVGGTTFVIVEERDRQAVEFTYAPGTTLDRAATRTVTLGTDIGNVGLEGMSFDPQTGGYIFVKEITPQGVFQTGIDFAAGTATNGSPTTANSIDLFDPALMGLGDIADVYALSNVALLDGTDSAPNLLVLSQEDGRIVEVTRSGSVVGTLQLSTDLGNPLSLADQQHEGLAMDDAGNLYVVSENGGGDFDHPQLWVYAPSSTPNAPPTALTLQNAVTEIVENSNTTARVQVAEIVITDDGLGTNVVSLTGADADAFEVDGGVLYLKAGTKLDFETQAAYAVDLTVDDTSLETPPGLLTSYTLTVTDLADEAAALPAVYISEVAPWSSGNSAVDSDWFEVTNGGDAPLDLTGWKFDDSSAVFAQSAALAGVTTLAPGESAIFIESADPAAASAAFISTWFGGAAPAGLQIGTYTGKGLGLSTGGDAVTLFDPEGTVRASLSFGASPASAPFATFDNAAALNGAATATLSIPGLHGAAPAAATADEIGSPGTVGRLHISEVAPWASGSSAVKADWFELTNSTAHTIDLAGWKMDDSSGSPAAAVALNGVASIAPGESVVFIETATPAAITPAFLANWFGAAIPAGLQIGSYTGSGVGLGSGGDGIHIYDAGNTLRTALSFGASPEGPYATFINPNALSGTAAKTDALSQVGTAGAFAATNSANEIGSPGNHPPGFTLQILHFYGESGILAAQTAPVLGAMMDKFRSDVANTLTLAEGDNWIPGPWLVAGADPSVSAVAGIGSTALARPDVAIMNALGVNASALGNHEFDLGSAVVSGAHAASGAWGGATFPFITANLDFSKDSALRGLADATLGGTSTNAFAGKETSSIAGKIAPYAVTTINGEQIGIIGATTFELLIKTSPNGTRPLDDGDDATSDIQEVAAYLQTGIDALTNAGIDKIIMVDQLDTLARNKELAPLLTGVDVMVAGGGHERLGDATDVPGAFNGHDADFISTDTYPIVTKGADGAPTLIVTTDTEYSYLGRLVVPFTSAGQVDVAALNPAINGAYAANQSTLQAVYGSSDTAQQIIDSSATGKAVQAITSAVEAVVIAKDTNKFGFSDVYLEGDRVFGRAQEVNLGSLTADANAAAALAALPAGAAAVVSFKNGGGLRASIGSFAESGNKVPNAVAPGAAGNVSQLDVENALRFDNKLMVFDTTPQGLLAILNYAAGLAPGNGGFIQLGGLRFSYDPDLAAGERVRTVALYDLAGELLQQVVADGQVLAGAPAAITAVALNFMAQGGDGYPMKANGSNFRYILNDGTLSAAVDAALDFTAAANVPANALGEQVAFQTFMTANHGTPETAYNVADTPASQDLRIENLNLRADAVLDGADQLFTVAATDARLAEGDAGSKDFTFTVARSGDTASAAEIGWSVAGIAGPGSNAANAADFAGSVLPAGTLSFAPGQTSQTVTVAVAGDTAGEANEAFRLSLGSLPASAASPGGAVGVILADDASLSIGPLDANRSEGSGSASTDFTFRIHRNGPATVEQTVSWTVAGAEVSGSLAASAADFAGGIFPSGTATFAPGDDNVLITVPVAADTAIEANEHFTVTLSDPTGGAVLGRSVARGDILNDDGARYSIGPAFRHVLEGTGPATTLAFTVTRTGTSEATDTLDWITAPGAAAGTMPASAADFVGGAFPAGTVSFAPGQHSATIEIAIAADAVRELNESFAVTLSNPSEGAAIGRAAATAAIIDDDTILVLGNGDTVSGTDAVDYFLIGAGDHTVNGLAGTDRFAFLAAAGTGGGTTTLADFAPAAGERIDLSRIDAIAGTLARDAFTFVAAFTGTAGELAVGPAPNPGQLLAAGDLTGDGLADFRILLPELGTPQPAWFIL